MITRKGWAETCMMSLFTKETTYDAGVTMTNVNACQLRGFDIKVDWNDVIVNDKDTVSGQEHGTDQELLEKRVSLTYHELRAKPNSVAGMLAGCMGAPTSTQDAGLVAYKHSFAPVALGTALPSFQVEHQKGTAQYKYTGCKVNSVSLSAQAGGLVELEAEIIGSGTRATSATAMVSPVVESYLKANKCKVWMESGALISIDSVLTQNQENISSGTPTDLKARMLGFKWKMNNNLEGQTGFGAGGVYADIDVKRRQFELSFDLLFNTTTEIDLFLNQTPCAFEVDLADALIAVGGTFLYGVHLVVPRFKVTKAPVAEGGPDDFLKCTVECDVQSDGTNTGSKLAVQNAQTRYLG